MKYPSTCADALPKGSYLLLLGLVVWLGCGHPTERAEPEAPAFQKGLKCVANSDTDGAIAAFTLACDQNPHHAKALFRRGILYAQKRQVTNALSDLTEAIRIQTEIAKSGSEGQSGKYPDAVLLDAELPEVYVQRGALFNSQKRYDDAIADLTEATRLQPSCNAFTERAASFYAKGLADLAMADLHAALRLDPQDVDALFGYAETLFKTGNATAAIRPCQKVIQLDPKRGPAYRLLGTVYASSTRPDFAKAVTYLEEATRLSPQLARDIAPDLASAYYNLGVALDLDGKRDEASRAFKKAEALDPTNSDRVERHRVGRKPVPDPAERDKALQVDASRAAALLDQGEYDESLAEFTALLQVDPRCVEAYIGRAKAYLAKGFPDSAATDLTEAIRLSPGNTEALCLRSRAWVLLDAHYRAVEDAGAVIRMRPAEAAGYRCRGLAYLDNRKYDRAVADLCETVRLDPKSESELAPQLGEAYRGLGLDQARSRAYDEAQRDLAEAIRWAPSDARNYEALGLIYSWMKNWEKAVSAFREAIRLDPNLGPQLRVQLDEAERKRSEDALPPR